MKERENQFHIINNVTMEETMNNMEKCLVVSGAGILGVVGIMLMVKGTRHRHQTGRYEKVGTDIDEKLRESREAFDKATAHVQSVFEHIKNRKP